MNFEIQVNEAMYSGRVATASAPMAHWTHPSARTGFVQRSARPLTHSAPSARPRMNAESMSSKECVALPRTRESILIQAIS